MWRRQPRSPLDQFDELSADELDGIITTSLQRQLAAGVTSVRDLDDYQWAVVERRWRGNAEGPRIVASGPPITIEQGHCASMGGAASGIEELRTAVRERAARAADIVNIMTSGGTMIVGTDVLACQFTLAELCAVVDEAHTVGLAVTAHAHALPAVEQCVAAGVDGIEHCSCLTASGIKIPPELAERIAVAGTVVCPTLGNALGAEPPPRVNAILERLGLTLETASPKSIAAIVPA